MTYRQFWQNAAELIFPKGRKNKLLREMLQEKTKSLNDFTFNNMTSKEKSEHIKQISDEIIMAVEKAGNIKEAELNKIVKYNDRFLKDSIEGWDFIDIIFVMSVSAVSMYLSEKHLDMDKLSKIHDEHSGEKAVGKYGNAAHYKMPNDTVPNGHMGVKNPREKGGASFKLNDDQIGVNHRYLYGHDILKPWEIFKNSSKIADVDSVFGSKRIGIIVKQINHLWYDLFSKVGIPAPGATYFAKAINAKLSKEITEYNNTHLGMPRKTMAEEMQRFSIHIEDVIKAGGVEALIQGYCAVRRTCSDIKNETNFFYFLDRFLNFDIKSWKSGFIGSRAFKEYEFGMIIYMNIIVLRGLHKEIAWLEIDLFAKDLIQWVRLNIKWEDEYRKYIINILQKIGDCTIPEKLMDECREVCSLYDIEFKNNIYYVIEVLNNRLSEEDA